MDNKLYTVVGTSNLYGVIKFRVANGDPTDRQKVLERLEHTDVKLVVTPSPMLKDAAIDWYIGHNPETAAIRRPNQPKVGKSTKL
jgi:hypothetical protein